MEASICRVCLENNENMVNIFDRTHESGTCIANILSYWSGYPVERDDPFPKTICKSCLQDAENAYDIDMDQQFDEIMKPSLEVFSGEEVSISKESELAEGAQQEIHIKEEVPDLWGTKEPQVINEPLIEDIFEEEQCHIADSDSIPAIKGNVQGTFYTLKDRDVKMDENLPFKCPHCVKSFSSKKSYTQHFKIHLGKRRYMCYLCSATFKAAQILKVHMRIHTGERPFPCVLCDMTFTTNSNLNRHMRTVHSSTTMQRQMSMNRTRSLPPITRP
ncbi:zinc finger protein Xfin-like [Drosophila subpulchrella]|uniref:zinc finger protein Xfin-like n=1 Tax=Drosophila subpulchrella TaxID=1486046 RepID=UPI0018A19A36|nr:zinc finger protein Xfin-like [Drosophila subpulchrella]